MSNRPIVFGGAYSVYVRAVRLTLTEKHVTYDLREVDVFAAGGAPASHLVRQPFGRIPAFEHDGFRLYETTAINRYVDEAFTGPPLQPDDPRQRARMAQVIGVMDSYVYRTLVWDIYVERVSRPSRGEAPDEARIAAALPKARVCLRALADLIGDAPWLAGPALSLADLHAAPMFACFCQAPEAWALLTGFPRLREWWETIAERRSMVETSAAVPARRI